jgi:DNA-binding HxlR family transcriptional regulator
MKQAQTSCPIAKTVALLSDCWTMLIIQSLLSGPKRFSELERALDGISTRTLALKLKRLEKDGVIHKAEGGGYETTPKGEGLKIVERAMRTYGNQFL